METLFTTEFWYYAPIISTLTATIAGAINGKFNISGFYSQLVAWITGTILSIASWFIGIVHVGEPAWISLTFLCVIVGLSSNGIYDIPFIKGLIDKTFPSKK